VTEAMSETVTEAMSETVTEAMSEEMTEAMSETVTEAAEPVVTEAAATSTVTGSMELSYDTALSEEEKNTEVANVEDVLTDIFGAPATATMTLARRRKLLAVIYNTVYEISGVTESNLPAAMPNLETSIMDAIIAGTTQNVTVSGFTAKMTPVAAPTGSPTHPTPYLSSSTRYYSLPLGYLTMLILMIHW